VIKQAELRAKDGGLNLAGARLLWPAAHLSRASAVLPYLSEHRVAYSLDASALDCTNSVLAYYGGLSIALLELHRQSPAAAASFPDLASLLSGSPRSQHDLAEGVFANRLIEVQQAQPDDRHRARLRSAGGLTAGAWLSVFPVTMWSTARARHYQMALAMRVGHALPELLPVQGVRRPCGHCGATLDEYGFHPGACKRVATRMGSGRLGTTPFSSCLSTCFA
jgi:hypothetical protein